MVNKINNQAQSVEHIRAISEDNVLPKLQFPRTHDHLLMKELLSSKNNLVFENDKTSPRSATETFQYRYDQVRTSDKPDGKLAAERSQVAAAGSEREEAGRVIDRRTEGKGNVDERAVDERDKSAAEAGTIRNLKQVAVQTGSDKGSISENQHTSVKSEINLASADEATSTLPRELSTTADKKLPAEAGDKAGGILKDHISFTKGTDTSSIKAAPEQASLEGRALDGADQIKAGAGVGKEDLIDEPVVKIQSEIRQLDLPANVTRVPVAETMVINKLPPSFSEQIKLVAEYIQLSVANAKQRQSVCIKLQPDIMPDAQLFLARKGNHQLDITMVSQRDTTLAWFNGLAPRLASYLGSRLNEPINVTVKNGTASEQGFARQQSQRQQENS